MKIFGFVENNSVVFGHGDSRDVMALASDVFFKSKKSAEEYVEEDEKKPCAGQVINGRWVDGKEYLTVAMIKEFELIE